MSGRFSALRISAIATLLMAIIMPVSTAVATPPPVHNIATCAALEALGQDASTKGDTIHLTADLDCSGIPNFAAMYLSGFSGTFDGQGHSITHLNISMPNYVEVGLFRDVSGGT